MCRGSNSLSHGASNKLALVKHFEHSKVRYTWDFCFYLLHKFMLEMKLHFAELQ